MSAIVTALGSPSVARVVVRVWFAELMQRHRYDFEAAIRAWHAAWDGARLRVEIHEPELVIMPGWALHFGCMPPPLVRAVSKSLDRFGSARLAGHASRAVLRRCSDDGLDDPQALAKRLWSALMRALPRALQSRARRALR